MKEKAERIEVVGNHTIHWDLDVESLLQEFSTIFNDLFKGTSYIAARNSTPGEKSVDIFWGEPSVMNKRVAHAWPKLRTENMDLCVQTELVNLIKDKVVLPDDDDIKPGRYSGWRTFKKIPMSKALEILGAIAGTAPTDN